jgi:hypothetical protein
VSIAPVFSLLYGLSSLQANTVAVDDLEIGYDNLLSNLYIFTIYDHLMSPVDDFKFRN